MEEPPTRAATAPSNAWKKRELRATAMRRFASADVSVSSRGLSPEAKLSTEAAAA
jgi:hypothetical protein